jgi:hypothetical protein
MLLSTNAPRRHPHNKGNGGDSVYWKGELMSAKAYHKGPQLESMKRDAKKNLSKYTTKNAALKKNGKEAAFSLSHKELCALTFDDRQIDMANRLLRLELQVNSSWFRRHAQSLTSIADDMHSWQLEQKIGFATEFTKESGKLIWQRFTPEFLTDLHRKYFSSIIGSDKVVKNMDSLLEQLEAVHLMKKGQIVRISAGQALAAHNTFLFIEKYGFEQAKARALDKAISTFYRHLAILKAAGFSSADLCAGKILPLRSENHLCLSQPVLNWQQLELLCSDAANEVCYQYVEIADTDILKVA